MIRYRPFIMRVRRDGTIISDSSGWLVSLFGDRCWIARFGAEWRERYPWTWACGCGRDRVWFYTPRER